VLYTPNSFRDGPLIRQYSVSGIIINKNAKNPNNVMTLAFLSNNILGSPTPTLSTVGPSGLPNLSQFSFDLGSVNVS
jgi:hypothetical protein